MRVLSIVLLAVAMFAVTAPLVSANDCSFNEGTIYDSETVWKCFASVPVDEANKETTLTALERAFPLYAFLDIQVKPPASELSLHDVDLMKEFARIRSTKYESEYAFQSDLANTFILLHDAHTTYRMDHPYTAFTFVNPIIITSFFTGTEQIVSVPPFSFPAAMKKQIEAKIGMDLDQFINATVYEINQEPALDHVVAFAKDHIGVSKDIATRLNLAVAQFMPRPDTPGPDSVPVINGIFTARNGYWGSMPEGEDTIEFGFKFPNGTMKSYKFPWLVLATANVVVGPEERAKTVVDKIDLLSPFKEQKKVKMEPIDILSEFAKDAIPLERVESITKPQLKLSAQKVSRGGCSGEDCFTVLANSENVHGYGIVSAPDVAVLQIDTFAPSLPGTFGKTIATVLDKAYAEGRHKLILDLTKNGGGDICAGRRTIQYILPDGKYHPFPPTDMPQSPVANAMAAAAGKVYPDGVWGPKSYTKDDGTQYTGGEWLVPGRNISRVPGIVRGFSDVLHLSEFACSYDAPDYIPAMRKNISEIIIVTRGLCGSTCAFVANHAAIFSHIKTVVVGGIHGMPMQYTSFPGFQVLDSPFIRQEVSSYGIDPSLVPPALPNDARYRMCVRQIYPTRYETIPTEFTFMHADYHFSDTLETVLYPELSWLQVVNLFD